MAVKVKVPNKNYNEVFAGVRFVNGVGVFEDEAQGIDVAKTLGYEYEAEKAPAKPKATRKRTTAKKATAEKAGD